MYARLVSLWTRLTRPSNSVVDPSERRQAALLASLFLSLVFIGVVVQTAIVIADPLEVRSRRIIAGILTVGIVLGAFFLSRTRYYIVAAIVFVIAFDLYIFLATLADPDLNILFYLLVPTLLSSILISLRMTVLLSVVNLIGTFVVIAQSERINVAQGLSGLVGPVLILTVLFLIIARFRDRLEADQRAELAESETRYRTLLESTFDGLAILVDGAIVEVNDGFLELFGFTRDEVLGQRLSRFLPDVDTTTYTARIEDESLAENAIVATDDDEPLEETVAVDKDEHVLDVEYVARRQSFRDQPALVVAIRNIAARRRAEEALRQAQRLDSLGMLAGGIAHDFNNMLTGILGQASLALYKIGRDDAARRHVEKMVDSAERAANLTRQLLAYAGKASFEVGVFDLNQVVRDNMLFLTASIPKHVHVELALWSRPLYVRIDSNQLQQVLLNLVVNAAESIGKDAGTITIATSAWTVNDPKDVAHFVNAGSIVPGPFVALAVTDTGQGMDRKTRNHIFDPFFTTKPTGHGLGLASTLGVVRSLRGAIAVESEPGDGAAFTVLLPQVALETEPAPLPPAEAAAADEIGALPPSHDGLILVVDDEAPVREAVVDILGTLGVRVLTARDGREGLQLFRSHHDDVRLTILDLNMPIMDGERTLRAMRALDPATRVILSSGYSETEMHRQFADEANVDFLQKPFDLERLVTMVNRALDA